MHSEEEKSDKYKSEGESDDDGYDSSKPTFDSAAIMNSNYVRKNVNEDSYFNNIKKLSPKLEKYAQLDKQKQKLMSEFNKNWKKSSNY